MTEWQNGEQSEFTASPDVPPNPKINVELNSLAQMIETQIDFHFRDTLPKVLDQKLEGLVEQRVDDYVNKFLSLFKTRVWKAISLLTKLFGLGGYTYIVIQIF